MKTRLFFPALLSVTLVFIGCQKDDDEPVVKVTYTKDVKPIMVANCTPCHVAGGANPNKFDEYMPTKNKITSILDRVTREESAAGFMPAGGTKLSSETIDILNNWVADGTLE